MRSNMLVSVVIPIYSVADYLPTCIESVMKQTYSEKEIILVDDGSPDSCPSICDTLAQNDSRIKVLHKQNGGLSDARNAGLEIASGTYIVFIDGDDFWIDKKQLETLMKTINENPNCDFIGFNCSYYYQQTNTYKKWVRYSEEENLDKDCTIQKLIESGTFPMSACLKIIKRTFLIENQIFFKKGQLSEDIPWFMNLLDKAQEFKFINQYIYAYRQNVTGSLSGNFPVKHFDDILDIIKSEIKNLNNKYKFNTDTKDAIYSFLAYEFLILLSRIYRLDKKIQTLKRKELTQYKWLLKYTKNPKVKKVALINKILGLRLTEYILSIYDYKK